MFLGFLGLAQGLPLLLFQLVGGVLADRVNRLRLLIVTQIMTSLALTAAFGLAVMGLARVEHLLALAAASSVFRAFDEPSRMAMIPQLVDRERLPSAIALGSIPWQAGRMIGPSVTGLLIAAFGGSVGFGLAAASSYVALALYARVRIQPAAPASDDPPPLRSFLRGLAFVRGHFFFAGLVGLSLFHTVFGMSYLTILPIYADQYFGTGSTRVGSPSAAHRGGSP